MIAFGEKTDWQMPLIELALQCEKQVQDDWRAYCEAYDRGAFGAAAKA